MLDKKEVKLEELEKVSGGAGYEQNKYYLFRNYGLATQVVFGPYSTEDEYEDQGFRAIKNSLSNGIHVANVMALHNNEYRDRTSRYFQLLKYL